MPSNTELPSSRATARETLTAFKDVNLISMAGGSASPVTTSVIISNGEIISIGNTIPTAARVIDGRGKWLMPGMIDMHVHLPADSHFGSKLPTEGTNFPFSTQDVMTPFVANGVTTVLELNSRVDHFSQRNDIEKGLALGPRMGLAALINGGQGEGRRANTAPGGRQAVRDAKAEGYDFIKVYSDLQVDVLLAILDEADKSGMKVVGHIPNACKSQTEVCLTKQFKLVAHAEELAKQAANLDEQNAEQLVALMQASGAWISPTLVTVVDILAQTRSIDAIEKTDGLAYVHPLFRNKWLTANNYARRASPATTDYLERLVAFDAHLVTRLNEAGVPIVIGTDTGTSGVVGGFSFHDEMELLAKAGMRPEQLMAAATIRPAQWLGIDSKVGTIEVGKRADFVLLDGNPLVDIKNTRRIAGVSVDGRWLARETLDSMLSDLARRNSADRDKYDWKSITGR